MSIQFPVTIKVMYEKEALDAPYVAYIPEFDVSSCGKTEKQAKKNVRGVLEIILEEAQKKDKLEELLEEAGIYLNSKKIQFPKIDSEPFVFQA